MRIIIADDSEILRSRLIEIVSDIPGTHIVGCAESSSDVIEAVAESDPDVVILDISMPGGNGIVALEAIKKRKKCPLIVMFTNYPYLQYRKKCLEAGADYFYYKSNEFEKLIKLLKRLAKEYAQA